MEQNKTGKYLKYAIGEIILVVIGILIALSINNWNNDKKDNRRKAEHIKTLINDLKKDSIVIEHQNKYMQLDLDKIIDISKRLSQPNATIDTVKQIYNYEFDGRFDPSNSFNKNAFNTIISTGDLNLFDSEFKNYLLTFYQNQDRRVQVIIENIKLNMDKFKILNLPPKERVGIGGVAKFGIRGKLLKQMIAKHTDEEFLIEFSKFLSNKAVMEENIIHSRKDLLKSTTVFLQYLYPLEND